MPFTTLTLGIPQVLLLAFFAVVLLIRAIIDNQEREFAAVPLGLGMVAALGLVWWGGFFG